MPVSSTSSAAPAASAQTSSRTPESGGPLGEGAAPLPAVADVAAPKVKQDDTMEVCPGDDRLQPDEDGSDGVGGAGVDCEGVAGSGGSPGGEASAADPFRALVRCLCGVVAGRWKQVADADGRALKKGLVPHAMEAVHALTRALEVRRFVFARE